MGGDTYVGLLLLALVEDTDDSPLCDMDRCSCKAEVQRGNHRVCLSHALYMSRPEGGA